MKKIMILSALLVTCLFICGVNTQAQTSKRIQFAKGKNFATVKGTTGKYGAIYVVKARSGQKMILSLTPAQKVGIKVETRGADGEMVLLREARGGTYEILLDETGDYTIFIGSTGGQPVSFALTVTITNLTDI